MSSTEEQVKSVILKYKRGARKQQIARELGMGLDYIDLICRELERKGELAFRKGVYSLITADHKPPKPLKKRLRVLCRPLRLRSQASKHKQKKFLSNVHRESVLLSIPKMTKELMHVLEKAGYKTIESLADAPIARLMQETNLKLHEAAGLINQARKILGKIKDNEAIEEE